MDTKNDDLDDFDFDWPCLNEADGLDCEYPFCQCESLRYSEYFKELPDIFEEPEFRTEYKGEWLEEE